MNIKRNIYIMYAISLLQGMVFYASIATLYRQASNINIFQITLIESVTIALCLILELPWGIIADKIGYKKTILICNILYFVSKIVFWKANNFASFLSERIILSVVISGLSGVDTSILFLSSSEDKSQKVFGIYNNMGTCGLLIAALVYSLFVKDQYRLSALLTAVTYGIAAILSFGLKEVKNTKKLNENKGETIKEFFSLLKDTLKNKYLVMLLVATAFINESHQTITVFLNQLKYTQCGLSNSYIGFIYIAITIVGLLGGLSDKITKKLGRKKFGIIIFISATISCAILAITHSAILSITSIGALRLCFFLYQPLQTDLQNKEIKTENRATALSINAVLIDSIAVFTNLLFGKLSEINLSIGLALGCVLCFFALILFVSWEKHTKINVD